MLRHAIKLRKSGARPCCFQSSLRCQSTGRDSKPDILVLNKCSLFKFGDPTSEPSKALFRDLTWRIRDESVTPSNSDVKPVAWALIGPKANVLVDAALLGRARADPPESRKWPFLGTSKPLEQAIKKVSFTTRLESNSYLSQGGEFTDYTARYYGIRKDDEDAITLKEHLTKHAKHEGVDALTEDKAISDVATMLKLDHLLEIPLIALSNGQTRRARIARALLTQPEVLILEEPFTGLDVSSRKLIADLLGRLHEARSPRIVLILRPQDEIPSWVDNIIQMGLSNTQNPAYSGAKSAWTPRDTGNSASTKQETSQRRRSNAGDPETFTITNANIKYHDRHILKDISWKLRAGDRAVLTGANGSGKSTLLSLILGDHPASYSQDLHLFSQPRSKHSVYSLSQRIGHYSPELFASFPRRYGEAGLSLYEVIGSGFENIFTYRKLTEEQKKSIVKIIDQFDVERKYLNEEELHNTLFAEAEPSLQALSLVLRAAVKKPDLLVLDEPFAGMSPDLVQQCRQFLDHGLEDHQTLIFISHYEEEWPSTIGKRMHLEDGRGSATEL